MGRDPRRGGLALLVAVLLLVAGCGASEDPDETPVSPIVWVAPRVTAGDALEVNVGGVPDGAVVRLTVLGSLALGVRTATAAGGVARFALDPTVTRAAGVLTLLARTGGGSGSTSTLVEPGAVVGPVRAVVGARSIVADATDTSMAVTMPVDRLGNVIAEGSPVDIVHRAPDGSPVDTPVTVAHLLAWQEIRSGLRAGTGEVSVRVGERTGPAVTLDEVAAPPAPFTLAPVDPAAAASALADGQGLVEVRTEVLRDPAGNVADDGTTVLVSWTGPQGSATTTGLTVAGVAQVAVPAPSAPGTVTVTARARGTDTAAPLALGFAPAVTAVPLAAVPAPGGVAVTVGPVRLVSGPTVPDGTDATVTLRAGSGPAQAATVPLVNGTATTILPVPEGGGGLAAGAEVLGAQGTTGIGGAP